MDNILVYTDGSGTTGGDAGWAFALVKEGDTGHVEVASGYLEDATNNVARGHYTGTILILSNQVNHFLQQDVAP